MEKLEEWETAFRPVFMSFMAALSHCDSTCERQWAPALLSNADQLRAATKTLEHWHSEHPCPEPDFEVALTRLARSFAYAANSIETVSKGSSVRWLLVQRELQGLHALVAKVLTLHYEHVQRLADGMWGS